MKAKSQNQAPGLQNRAERLGTQHQDGELRSRGSASRWAVDFRQRRRNRRLQTHTLLNLLRSGLPDAYDLAEVVGRWVWVQFRSTPAAELRRQLAQFGFHWNRARQAWQHPCGLDCGPAHRTDPRRYYGSYFAADVKPA